MQGESDLAFDTAKPRVADFDAAFWAQTIIARGGKSILSAEIWNATKPVLLRNVAAFGGNGDYSIITGGMGTASGFPCKNITVSAKASNMEGQMVTCVGTLDDVNLTFIASANAAGEGGFEWDLKSIVRETAPLAYYPQCLAPVSCPSLSRPTQQENDQCGSQGKSMETTRDGKGCVTAYECITNEERARRNMASSQRPGCAIDENLVKENADCWSKQGNANYQQNQNGCIVSVKCNLPSQGSNMAPQGT